MLRCSANTVRLRTTESKDNDFGPMGGPADSNISLRMSIFVLAYFFAIHKLNAHSYATFFEHIRHSLRVGS